MRRQGCFNRLRLRFQARVGFETSNSAPVEARPARHAVEARPARHKVEARPARLTGLNRGAEVRFRFSSGLWLRHDPCGSQVQFRAWGASRCDQCEEWTCAPARQVVAPLLQPAGEGGGWRALRDRESGHGSWRLSS
eukprot:351056-Chlamydomonas_euryale.AAC.2